ncbi:MAG: recombination mediator RecR [Patescibacteria group bacterium]|nr:recombination mediator RecR [Patescibacteria group bacterium]
MTFPKQIQDLTEAFERLPGVGPKSAARLAFYLLHMPEPEVKKFGEAVLNLKSGIQLCSVCKNFCETEVCEICVDDRRNQRIICVVETPLDVFSLEKVGKYNGLYHVLHGVIDPLHNIGPEELYIESLVSRIAGEQVSEIILALNPTMEGEATAMFIAKKLQAKSYKLKVTRLGMGMPTGGDIQYADETTLSRALEGRRDYE